MTVALASHVHLAVLGDDVVLLDTAADAYMCVPDGVAQLRPSEDRGAVAPPSEVVTAALVAAGLVQLCGVPSARARLTRPTCEVCDVASVSLSVVDALRLCGALWDLVTRYRGRSLDAILAFVIHEGQAQDDAARPDVVRLANLFQRAAVWLPMPRKCLVRSFVLLRFLQRSGVNARWVFGVTAWPFRAHCWLQAGDMALDDSPERIVEYEPILAVG